MNPGALSFAFKMVMAGALSQGTRLELEMVSSQCRCEGCRQRFEPVDLIFACPHCGELLAAVPRGQELKPRGLEVS